MVLVPLHSNRTKKDIVALTMEALGHDIKKPGRSVHLQQIILPTKVAINKSSLSLTTYSCKGRERRGPVSKKQAESPCTGLLMPGYYVGTHSINNC